MNRYLLDSDSFIQSQNIYYGFDFCPGFWKWLVHDANKGVVCSIEHVRKEIIGFHVDDSLKEWVNDRDDTFFLKNDAPTMLSAYRRMATWAVSKEGDPYVRPAIDTFLASADMWLIAYAQLHEFTIVTQERPSGSLKFPRDQISKTKIKIPDVCRLLNIPCINIHELLKRSGVKLVIGGGFSGFPDDVAETSEEEALWEAIDEFNESAAADQLDEFDD